MKSKKIFWGLFFLLAAVFVIVNQLGMFTEINILSLFFTIFLVAVLIKSSFHFSYSGILFSIAFLCIIYADTLNITNLTPWPVLLTALLGSIGLSFIFGHHHHCHRIERDFETEVIDADNMNKVDINVSFGASTKYINSKDVERINVSCSFGAAKIYLNNIELKKDKALINLNISFAGVEIYLPKDWKIENKVDVSLGTIEEKNQHTELSNKTLILTGKVSLSGVEIIYI